MKNVLLRYGFVYILLKGTNISQPLLWHVVDTSQSQSVGFPPDSHLRTNDANTHVLIFFCIYNIVKVPRYLYCCYIFRNTKGISCSTYIFSDIISRDLLTNPTAVNAYQNGVILTFITFQTDGFCRM